jgi:hypothetical protein
MPFVEPPARSLRKMGNISVYKSVQFAKPEAKQKRIAQIGGVKTVAEFSLD